MSLCESAGTANKSRFAPADGRAQNICRRAMSGGVLLLTVLWTGFVWAQNETTDLNAMEEDYVTPVLKYQILSPDVRRISGPAIPAQPGSRTPAGSVHSAGMDFRSGAAPASPGR